MSGRCADSSQNSCKPRAPAPFRPPRIPSRPPAVAATDRGRRAAERAGGDHARDARYCHPTRHSGKRCTNHQPAPRRSWTGRLPHRTSPSARRRARRRSALFLYSSRKKRVFRGPPLGVGKSGNGGYSDGTPAGDTPSSAHRPWGTRKIADQPPEGPRPTLVFPPLLQRSRPASIPSSLYLHIADQRVKRGRDPPQSPVRSTTSFQGGKADRDPAFGNGSITPVPAPSHK